MVSFLYLAQDFFTCETAIHSNNYIIMDTEVSE